MLTFALCPHDSEDERELKKWKHLANSLSQKLHKTIKLVTFANYIEEKIKLPEANYDLYYANPVASYFLYKNGYKPAARLKDKKDTFVVIGYKNNTIHHTTLTTTYIETHMLPMLIEEEFDFVTTDVVLVPTQKEIYERVKAKKVEYGIMYEDSYDAIKDSDKPPIVARVPSNFHHTLMVKPNLYKNIQKILQTYKEFELIDEEEFLDGITEKLPIISFLKTKEFFDVSKALYNNPFVGVLIYKNKIEYANEALQEKFGYTLQELEYMSPEEMVCDEQKAMVKEAIQRRINGEFFSKGYEKLIIKTKDEQRIYTLAFANTILYKNSYAGLVFLVDITKEVLYQKLYKALRNVNRAITTVLTEEELAKIVCETLVSELDIKFVWIGVPDPKGQTFQAIYKCGEEQDYLDHIKVFVGGDLPQAKGPTGRAYKERAIVINPDTKENPVIKPWRTEMLKRGFLSSAAVPILKNGKVHAVLNIYSPIPHFFDDLNQTLLEELQHDLSFAVQKIETIKKSIILEKAVEKGSEFLVIANYDGYIEYVNEYACKISGYQKEDLLNKHISFLYKQFHSKSFSDTVWQTIVSGNEFSAIFVNRSKNGTLFYLDLKIIPVTLPNGEKKFVALGRDITKEKELLKENEQLRFYDALTGLYNYNGFAVQVEKYLQNQPQTICAFLLIDIANFSFINKTYGVVVGDKILIEIASRLKQYLKKSDIIARVGGDEFSICFKNIKEKEDLFLLIERVKNILDRSSVFTINGMNLTLTIHGGISIYPDDGTTFQKLLENASVALQSAKKEGDNIIKIYNKSIEKNIEFFFVAEQLLNKAVQNDLFVFHYQPYIDVKTQEIVGFEALARIKDEDGTLHYPNEFIDLLENSHFLGRFRKWALNEVSQKIRDWKKPISINISAKSFKNQSLTEEVLSYAKNLPAPLTIEITERLYMNDPQRSKKMIERLKECKNIRISIDDFGTGYSSLSYLKDMHADILKIDISFVRAMMENEKSQAIVKAIITLAQALNMKTVAEGVETKEQYVMLKEFGVDYIQGYYFFKPLPEEEIEKLLKWKKK
ncbi:MULTISPECIES: EAL domain-containing protein [unclassified Nitratiruptor]|uniref:EAL domain-containing protein n=1 Tax=unclassified Nitratiruptor TaxID=2624044 RepID=UPI001915B97D|nr:MULTISPECIES: EAL domain-containing protein [unclassified Nitratiruptor]BCD59985.1 diguanylate cyclase/phosphodiesterase [Nitratiruptor sp. YY08-10]BCD63908.1 diguanylate cyclase/phosphodiesterase [Nitratiruptor sp. YY08-14]